jgi:PAS domain S-box-containing protein
MLSGRRRRNLEWFKTTLSSVRDAIVATDSDARVLLMNPAAERLTGWALADAEGKPLAEVLVLRTAAAADIVEHLLDEFRRCADVTSLGETILRRRDGSEVHIEDSAAPICCDHGTLLGFVLVLRDLTARHRQEEETARLVEELQRANRAKDEFLAMLGHELRNPLAPVVTTVQLIKLKAGDRVAHECTVLDRQLNHMIRLVNDLMDASRIARGKVEITTQPVDMADVVGDAVEMLSWLFDQHRQALDVSLGPDLRVIGDPDRLGQVFSNLLHNAAKYSADGSRVSLAAAREGPDVVVTVTDHGIGIEEGRLATIFEPFVQAPQPLDRGEGGLGLGLAIARALVGLHGGTIVARSNGPGTGSAFIVRLPALGAAAQGSPDLSPRSQYRPRGCECSVLIVEDNADAKEALAEALALLGYEPITASDGPEALAVVTTRRPSIALLDIGLPSMDGYELARRLRDMTDLGPLKLVALTGYGLPADRQRALASGFDEHLVKPAALEDIRTVIERLAPRPAA